MFYRFVFLLCLDLMCVTFCDFSILLIVKQGIGFWSAVAVVVAGAFILMPFSCVLRVGGCI